MKKIWNDCNNVFDFISIPNLSCEEIFVGITLTDQGKEQLVNHFLILVKYLIFMGRERGSFITMGEIKRSIKNLASMRNTVPLHLRTWKNWKVLGRAS